MKPEKVLKDIETNIARVTKDIKEKRGNIGSDKLNSLAKLVNSYSRLLERTKSGSDSNDSTRIDYSKGMQPRR